MHKTFLWWSNPLNNTTSICFPTPKIYTCRKKIKLGYVVSDIITNCCISTESISQQEWEHQSKIIYWNGQSVISFCRRFGYGSSWDALAGYLLTKRQFDLTHLTGNSQTQHWFNNSLFANNIPWNLFQLYYKDIKPHCKAVARF